MENNFKDFDTTPTLTLDPFQTAEEKQEPAVVEEKKEEVIAEENVLSEEERQMAEKFAEQIDLTNSNMILQYGAGTQKKMADFSESALENVRTKDLGEVGNLLSGVVKELKSFDEEEEKGFLGIFKKSSNKITAMKTKYAKAETNVNQICKVLESHQVQLMKDVALLDKMYELNLTYYKELTMYIVAGKKKLNEVRNGELQDLLQKAQATGLAEDAQAAKDLDSMCNRFEKKLHDLELTRQISMQTAPQIRLVQGNDTLMVEKIQSTTDLAKALEMEKKLRKDEFTLEQFLDQMQQVKKLGSLETILGLIPGMGGISQKLKEANVDEKEFDRIEAIIRSMTKKERQKPEIINGSRRKRIAAGCGMRVQDINKLLKNFEESKKMMKRMQGMAKFASKGGFKLPFGR